MQTREFIVVLHFFAYVHSPQPPNRVRVPLSWSFSQVPISLQLDYGSNSPSWTFGSKHLLHFSRVIPLLNNLSSDTPYLRKFLSKIYKDWSHKNLSNRTLGSRIQEKLGLNGALKICKLWNNGALKNTLPRLKYNQEWFEKV